MNQQQQQAIEYLREESQVLREQLGGRREVSEISKALRTTDIAALNDCG